MTTPKETLTYVCLHLRAEKISSEAKRRLERKGFDYLDDGEPFCAYSILPDTSDLIDSLDDPDIISIERQEPPSSK